MAIRSIRKEGDPILRKISKPIAEITPRIVELANDMVETMHEAEGPDSLPHKSACSGASSSWISERVPLS